MKNTNLSFNPSEIVALTLIMRKFLIFGKPNSQLRKYFDGRWQYVGPKKYQKELADAKRAEEDAALAATVAATASKEARIKTVNAALRVDPDLKIKARKVRVSSAKELARLNGAAKVLSVEIDEKEKAKAAAEFLLEE